jgi:4'-phosphopantetheinyl transferase
MGSAASGCRCRRRHRPGISQTTSDVARNHDFAGAVACNVLLQWPALRSGMMPSDENDTKQHPVASQILRTPKVDLAPDPDVVARSLDVAPEVVVTRLDLVPQDVRALASWLSEGELQRAKRFAFDRDRRRFIVARARLRQLLSARLGMPPGSVEFSYGACGKPELSRQFAGANLRFNLSHSGEIAVYGFTIGREIGIDVEAVRELHHAEDLAARFYSRRENDAFRALDARDRARGFFNCWTRKEAFIKALGDGLSHALDRFDVSLSPDEPAKLIRVDDTPGEECGWDMESFSPAPGFVGAVVIAKSRCRFGSTAHAARACADSCISGRAA